MPEAGAGTQDPQAGRFGEVRRLGIPTVADRVVQAALKLVPEPVFEADFEPVSFGFRPGRRAHDAVADIHLFGSRGYRWVLDADIEACFDTIDHVALMNRVRARVKDKRVLALVKAFLKAGVLTLAAPQPVRPRADRRFRCSQHHRASVPCPSHRVLAAFG